MLNPRFSGKLAGGLLFMAALALAPVHVEGSDMPPMAPPVDGDISDIPASADKLEVKPVGLFGLFHHGCGGCGGCSGCSAPTCGGCMAPTCGGCAAPYGGGGVSTYGAYGHSYVTGMNYGYGYGYGAPGGYAGRIGRPYFYRPTPVAAGYVGCAAPQAAVVYAPAPMVAAPVAAQAGGYGYGQAGYGGGNIYTNHFGPGYYRNAEHGHYRFPYYSYRRPWYNPGPASYNRDTNLPW